MKKITKYFLSLTVFMMTLGLSSCQNKVKGFEFPDYKVSNNNDDSKVNLDKDEGMVIDGLLNEKEWESVKSNAYNFVHKASPDISLVARTYLGEKGVYFGKAIIDNKAYKAMINVGINPTINLNDDLKIEAHILDFSEDIYDEKISLTFLTYYRDEKKFESLDDLRNQLSIDANNLKKFN